MKKLIISIVLILGGYIIFPLAKQEVTKVYGKLYNRIEHELVKNNLPLHKAVKIHTKDSFCSGFKSSSGLIVTAAHCVGEKIFVISAQQEKDLSFEEYKVFQLSTNKDLVILSKIENIVENNKLLLQMRLSGELRETPVKIGEKLFVLGTNGDKLISKMIVRPLIVERIMFMFNEAIWGKAFNIEGGTSGSGVVDKDGKLIGVLSFVLNSEPEAGVTTILKQGI